MSLWWFAVATTGVGAGVVAIGLTLLLHLVQHVAFGYTENTFLHGVEQASALRRVLVLLIAGLIAGGGWWALRRTMKVATVDEAISPDGCELPVFSTMVDAALQIVVVGLGASLGREGAPRQVSAAIAGWLARRCQLDPQQRRILISAGAGAGLAAVYNVPVGGCLFAVEVLLGSASWAGLAPAALASAAATAVSWLVLPNKPTYDVGRLHLSWSLLAFSVLIGPVTGCCAHVFDTVSTWAKATAPTSWRILPATIVTFTTLGAAAIAYPQLLGNGKGPTELALTGSMGLATAAALTLLKPLVSVSCLRSGATGGLLTPSLATGALLGITAGHIWQDLWPGSQLGAFAFITAGAMLAVTQRAPLCAIALVLELTHTGCSLLVPLTVAVTVALVTDNQLSTGRRGPAPR